MNQDYVFASAEPVGNLPNLFVVADGMGGHNAGDYASSHAVQTLVDEIRRDADFSGTERGSCHGGRGRAIYETGASRAAA